MSTIPLTDNQRLRIDVGLDYNDTVSLSDLVADDAYARARALYADPTAANAAARVIVLEQFYAKAVTATDYVQNNTQEKASQLFANYGKLLDTWRKALEEAQNAAATMAGAARFGRTQRKPGRLEEYPGGPPHARPWGSGDLTRGL